MKKQTEVMDIKSNEPTSALATKSFASLVDTFANNIMTDDDLGSFYSISPTTTEEKVFLYNAINNPSDRLADHINEVIAIKDVLVEMVELENDESGELTKCPRIVLIDAKGKSYQCVSVGIFSGLKRMFKLFGVPTWETPVNAKVKQITKGKKQMLSLEVIV